MATKDNVNNMFKVSKNSFLPGDMMWDRYEVVELLGEGASAIVYKCYDRDLSDLAVAVKVFPANVAEDDVSAQRINRELRTSFSVDHPNVARFYNCLRDEKHIALVMEFIEGGTLDNYIIKQGGKLSITETRFILLQIAEGLNAIHAVGTVHRDLKPANVLISNDGGVKITDFGLAKGALGLPEQKVKVEELSGDSNAEQLLRTTSAGDCVGTPLYLSPEYLEHGYIDERSDIYALGIIAYEMYAGFEPFESKSFVKLVSEKIHGECPTLKEIIPSCPQDFSDIIQMAMSKDPEERYQYALDFQADLKEMKIDSASGAIDREGNLKSKRISGVHNTIGGEVKEKEESPLLGVFSNFLIFGLPILAVIFAIVYILMTQELPFMDDLKVFLYDFFWKLGF